MMHAASRNFAVATLALTVLAPHPADAAERSFRHTSLKDCKVVRSVPEEGGYRRSNCPGLGGYRLERVEADLRDSLLVLAPSGGKTSLSLASRSGGGFSQLRETIEWRGTVRKGRFRPDAMIVRHHVVEGGAQADRWTSYLWVVSLTPKPCLTHRVPPGPRQNEAARRAADAKLACLIG